MRQPTAHALHRRSLSGRTQGANPFRPLEAECRVVQFSQPLTPSELAKAGKLLAGRPDVQLYVYGRASHDLDFLKHFPKLKRLQAALYELESIDGLAHVAGTLEEFTFGQTKKTFSLGFLKQFSRLQALFLAGHKKDLSAIAGAPAITRLGLSMITLLDLSAILPLGNLAELSLLLGGTRDIGLLPRFGKLEKLMLMRITKMSDLGVLADLRGLKALHLDWMRNVTGLPSLAPLASLSRVKLDTMKGLTDLSAIAAAPALEELSITNMPQLDAAAFACLAGHPRLKKLWAYTGRTRVNQQLRAMFAGIAQ
jgi:hypothetical protein